MNEVDTAFQKRPFLSFPKTEVYFPGESIEETRKSVISVLERDAGIPLIFGKNGSGKSLLLKQIGKHFELECSVVLIANPGLKTPKAFFQQLLYEIHQPYCNLDENELRLLLTNYLHQFESPNLLLVIDEAQTLSWKVFEELRILLDRNHENSSKIQIVLAGTESFEEKLTHPKLSAFQQRVITRCYLTPFNWKETEDYVVWQMQKAGAEFSETVFTQEARKTIHKLTDGLPRLINQLGEESLFLAKSLQRKMIDENMVREAWRILQQMPITAVETSMKQEGPFPVVQESESVEFGELSDDEPDDFCDDIMDIPLETMESNSVDMTELTPDLEQEESVILKISHLAPKAEASPCEDFLQKMRVMEATIAQDFSTKNQSIPPKSHISNILDIPKQKPQFF